MTKYRLIETGPERDRKWEIQKKTIFGWRTIDYSFVQDRVEAAFDLLVNGPTILREAVV